MSLRQIAIGSAAMSSVTMLRMCTQFFVLPLLARYISPAEYGLIALSMPFVLFAMMFSDAGVSASLLRTSGKDMREWSTSFWFIIALGTMLALVILFVGFLASVFLVEPVLFPMIGALSLIIVLQSIATVPGVALQHRNRFDIIAGIEIVAMVFSLISTCLAAVAGWGAWSLVVQQLVHYAVKLCLTLFFAKFWPHFVFVLSAIKAHLVFGRDLLGLNLIMFVFESARNIIIGKVLGTYPVGIYGMSNLFADLPRRLVSGPLQVVLYPRMSEHKDDPEVLKAFFLFASKVIAIFSVPIIGMIAVAHEPVFLILLSEKWAQAGDIFMLASPAAIVMCVTALRGTVVMALGRTDIIVRQNLEMVLLLLSAICGAVSYGLDAVVITITVVGVVYVFYALREVFVFINLRFSTYLRAIYRPVLMMLLCAGSYLYLSSVYDFSDIWLFALAVALGAVSLLLSVLVQMYSLKDEVLYLKTKIS